MDKIKHKKVISPIVKPVGAINSIFLWPLLNTDKKMVWTFSGMSAYHYSDVSGPQQFIYFSL